MSAEVASSDIASINLYAQKFHQGFLQCRDTETKGRILVATRDFAQGEIILEELPLHIVQADAASSEFSTLKSMCEAKKGFDYDALWYWAALRSLCLEDLGSGFSSWTLLDKDRQERLLLLHTGEVSGPSRATQAIARQLVPQLRDVDKLERLLQAWIHNAFDFSDEPSGYATYYFPSFMSHSCYPSAFWHYGADAERYVLRARRAIAAGDEVTVSYLEETLLLSHVQERRWDLFETKQFWCACERCTGGLDKSRGLACPKCPAGAVFGRVPDPGPAMDGDLLAAHLEGAVCGACAHVLTAAEAVKLHKQEALLVAALKGWEERKMTETEAALTDHLLTSGLPQHALADKCWEHLAKFYKSKRQYLCCILCFCLYLCVFFLFLCVCVVFLFIFILV
ncbi:unnamed protein product [Polarella glacialis]|uniref:SET domain-containing protein n=1 Tax=Polarella glacialis TaxID=89957 RepID=A0A813L9Q5_POLGL|nr:unnamed protein product [Polarella glacialis]